MGGATRTAGLTGALLQLSAAAAVHAAAAGCLPGVRGLIVAAPVGLLVLLVLDRVLAGRPLVQLAAGQLTAHAALTLAAACTGHAAHAGAGSPVLMTFGHVGALVMCRALLGRAALVAERGAQVVLGLARRAVTLLRPVAVPVLVLPSPPVPSPLRSRDVTRRACVRGPPARLLLPVT